MNLFSTLMQRVRRQIATRRACVRLPGSIQSPLLLDELPAMLVLSPPKTGSITAWETIAKSAYGQLLRAKYPGLNVHDAVPHLHWLAKNSFENVVAALPLGAEEGSALRRDQMLRSIMKAHCFKRRLLSSGPGQTGIVTTVRDPIAIYVSSFFQNMEWWGINNDVEPVSHLSEALERSCFWYLEGWFDSELRQLTEFNLASCDFNQARGWSLYSMPNCTIGIIRTENLSALPEMLGELWEVPHALITLVTANRTEEKPHGQAYAATRDALKFPRHLVEKIYGTPAVQTLWTPEEIDLMVKKWS